jgi:DNA modification methylase
MFNDIYTEGIEIICGDALSSLKQVPDKVIQTCITSPPYWGLRDYGVKGQLGLEKNPAEYVEKIVEIAKEVRRVLRDDGTFWLNLGDTYHGGGGIWKPKPDPKDTKKGRINTDWRRKIEGLKNKDLIGIPWRVAFALQEDGWYLRSDIIWSKKNPMPESTRDRPTKSHEYIFLLAKNSQYYYDRHAIMEEAVTKNTTDLGITDTSETQWNGENIGLKEHHEKYREDDESNRRNKRSVWEINTQPYPETHFAVYPTALIEPCILAGSADQACPVCRAPWKRIIKREETSKDEDTESWRTQENPGFGVRRPPEPNQPGAYYTGRTVGWEPTCDCEDNDGSASSIVLDPFTGSGTTGLVALQHRRWFLGIEISQEYCDLIKKRLREIQVSLF